MRQINFVSQSVLFLVVSNEAQGSINSEKVQVWGAAVMASNATRFFLIFSNGAAPKMPEGWNFFSSKNVDFAFEVIMQYLVLYNFSIFRSLSEELGLSLPQISSGKERKEKS